MILEKLSITKPSQSTRHIWRLEKNQLDQLTSTLSKDEKHLVLNFIENPNSNFIKASKFSQVEIQDGLTERWQYYLSENLFVIVEGYIPGPWSSSLSGAFHVAILQEIHRG